MAARVDGQRGGPTVDSVVSVADLIARDAPWAGDPDAVDVGRPAVPAQRSSSPGKAGARSAGTAGAGAAGAVAAGKSTAKSAALQAFAARALGPQWRFVTGAAAVLVAGLLGNVIMVAVMSGPGTQLAQSEEGGYPADQVTEPPAALPLDAAPARSFTMPGVGLPLALASLAQSVPATNRAAAPVALPIALVGGVNSTTAPAATSTSVPARSGSSSAGGTLGGTVSGTVSGTGGVVGDTVGSVGGALPGPLGSPVKELGKTTSKTTSELGRTVEGLGDGPLGGGSRKSGGFDEDRDSGDSGSSDSDPGERSPGDRSKSSGSGGLLGGVGSLLGD